MLELTDATLAPWVPVALCLIGLGLMLGGVAALLWADRRGR